HSPLSLRFTLFPYTTLFRSRRARAFQSKSGPCELACGELHRSTDFGCFPGRACDGHSYSVRWSNLLPDAQAKCVPGNLTLDVRKKIFVCLDTQIRGSIIPIDLKCAAGVDVSKRANLAFVDFDTAVASNSWQPA